MTNDPVFPVFNISVACGKKERWWQEYLYRLKRVKRHGNQMCVSYLHSDSNKLTVKKKRTLWRNSSMDWVLNIIIEILLILLSSTIV